MPGGITIPPGTIANLGGIAYSLTQQQQAIDTPEASGPWRDPVWSKPALTMITVPAAYAHQATGNAGQVQGVDANGVMTIQGTGTVATTPAAPQIYVFDAVMRIGHSQPLTITKHPVQTGANITDHAYVNPARLSMQILMSDAQAPFADGMWIGSPSKSVSCFQILDGLKAQRIPLTVTTRLKTYTTMLLVDVRADDTVRTRYGLAASLELEQIIVASVATQAVSARPQTTGNTPGGTTQPTQVSQGTIAQNQLPSTSTGIASPASIQATTGTVQGAGTWSSNSTGGLAERFATVLVVPPQ